MDSNKYDYIRHYGLIGGSSFKVVISDSIEFIQATVPGFDNNIIDDVEIACILRDYGEDKICWIVINPTTKPKDRIACETSRLCYMIYPDCMSDAELAISYVNKSLHILDN